MDFKVGDIYQCKHKFRGSFAYFTFEITDIYVRYLQIKILKSSHPYFEAGQSDIITQRGNIIACSTLVKSKKKIVG